MIPALSRRPLLIVSFIAVALALIIVALLLPASSLNPYCQAIQAQSNQSATFNKNFSQDQFTQYVLATARTEEHVTSYEKGFTKAKELAMIKDYRALSTDSVYYKATVSTSPTPESVIVSDPKFEKFQLAVEAVSTPATITREASCHLAN
jgi:hypothetical protein